MADATMTRSSGWYYGWNIVAVCVLGQICANGLTYNTFSLFLHDWATETGTPISVLQLSILLMVVGCAIFSPIVGGFADRYSARGLQMIGLSGIALFYLAISFTTAGWQIVALYAVLGSASLTVSASVVVNAILARWFVRQRGLAMGLSALGVGMGGVILPPLIAALLPSLGWREVWRLGAAFVAIVLVPLMFLIVRHKPTEREGFHYVGDDAATASEDGGEQIGWREVLARKNFWLVICGYLPLMGVYAAYGQNLAPHAASHGLSQQDAGTLLSIFSVVHLVATFGLGPLSDRFSARYLFLALAITSAAGAVVVAFSSTFVSIMIGCALIGSAGGFNTLLAVALASEFGARGFGRAFGMSFFPLPLGSATAVVVAKIQEATGSYAPGLLAMAVIVMIGGFLSLLMDEKPKVAITISH